MKKKRIEDHGEYLVDEKHINTTDGMEAIVIDNVWDRDRQKPRVKVFRTSNVSLLAGSSTVAIAKITKCHYMSMLNHNSI